MQSFNSNIDVDTSRFLAHFDGPRFTELNQSYLEHLDAVGQPYPPSQAIPFFVPLTLQNVFKTIGRELFDRLETDAGEYLRRKEPAPQWPIPKHLQPAMSPGFEPLSRHPVIRMDLFIDPSTAQMSLLEINSADPSAFAWNDMMLEGLERHGPFSTFIKDEGYIVEKMVSKHLAMVLDRYTKHCELQKIEKKTSPTVALSIARDSTVYFDFVALERLYLRLGADAILVEPESFFWDHASYDVFAHGRKIDIIIRDTLDEVFFPNGEKTAGDLPTILLESGICVVNPTASSLGDQKAWLAILWQALQAEPRKIDEGTRMLKDILPETHLLTAHNLDYFSQDKNQWVLKPSFGYGGHGIKIGKLRSDHEWKASLEEAIAKAIPCIVQRHCLPGRGFLATSEHNYRGSYALTDRHAVFSVWLFEGEFVGAFARLSSDPIINTHQGGALVPVVWVP